jgi:hypothetical protein
MAENFPKLRSIDIRTGKHRFLKFKLHKEDKCLSSYTCLGADVVIQL